MQVSIETELGKEVRCASCLNFWPADAEFFYPDHGRLRLTCRACVKESRSEYQVNYARQRRQAQRERKENDA